MQTLEMIFLRRFYYSCKIERKKKNFDSDITTIGFVKDVNMYFENLKLLHINIIKIMQINK